MEVKSSEEVVALGLFCEQKHKRPLGFNVQTLHLNMTGSEQRDQIWPEYNGLLCMPEYKQLIYPQLLANLFQFHRYIDEFDAGLVSREDLIELGREGFVFDTQVETKTYGLELPDSSGHLALPFSSSLKNQLSRSKRLLQEQGSLEITFEFDRDKVQQKFNEMAGLHKQAWGQESGFHNHYFVDFHQRLIESSCDIQPMVASLAVNGNVIARNLNYQAGSTLCFYLGVAEKNTDNRIKSGLLLHAETVQAMQQWQCNKYDFLAGDYQYKKRMSNKVSDMCRTRIKRSSMKFKIESLLKTLKNKSMGLE